MNSYKPRRVYSIKEGQKVVSGSSVYVVHHIHVSDVAELVPDITAHPIHKGQVLTRSFKYLGKNWSPLDE